MLSVIGVNQSLFFLGPLLLSFGQLDILTPSGYLSLAWGCNLINLGKNKSEARQQNITLGQPYVVAREFLASQEPRLLRSPKIDATTY